MNFRQLEIFVRVVEEKSFTKAAKKLYVSQPALNKSIRALEEDVEKVLFERSAYGLELTEDGKTVYKYPSSESFLRSFHQPKQPLSLNSRFALQE